VYEGEYAICAKFRGEGALAGPWIWQDTLVRVSHVQPEPGRSVVLGHLIIDACRHAAYLDGRCDEEAAAVGLAARDAARALRAELDPAFVHAAVINTSWEHFHQHVYVRHRDTPDNYQWHRADEWPSAPHGVAATVAELSRRLAAHFPGSASD
jgi:diadenosine tetraphosphate (Ap4A) HIT family hydrolase